MAGADWVGPALGALGGIAGAAAAIAGGILKNREREIERRQDEISERERLVEDIRDQRDGLEIEKVRLEGIIDRQEAETEKLRAEVGKQTVLKEGVEEDAIRFKQRADAAEGRIREVEWDLKKANDLLDQLKHLDRRNRVEKGAGYDAGPRDV